MRTVICQNSGKINGSETSFKSKNGNIETLQSRFLLLGAHRECSSIAVINREVISRTIYGAVLGQTNGHSPKKKKPHFKVIVDVANEILHSKVFLSNSNIVTEPSVHLFGKMKHIRKCSCLQICASLAQITYFFWISKQGVPSRRIFVVFLLILFRGGGKNRTVFGRSASKMKKVYYPQAATTYISGTDTDTRAYDSIEWKQ